jgi:predicted nucleic acid-binding protein
MLANIPSGSSCFVDANIFFYHLTTAKNDSLTVAAMEKLGLTDIATNDGDFDSIAGLTVWKPR